MRMSLLIVAGVALAGFLAVVFLQQKEGAERREAAQMLISGAESAKKQLAASAEKSGNLAGVGKEVKISAKADPKYGEMKWIVLENGDIRGWNEKNALEVTMTPTLQAGKASWNCKGYPITAMPASCGGRP
jgi:hypothetical protein